MKPVLENVDTLAIRCPNWVGDIVMATPVFDCLRRNLPRARLIGILKRNSQGILRDGPWFDSFVDANDKSWAGLQHMRNQLRALTPGAAILLTNSARSALALRWSGIKHLYGYRRQWRDLLLTGGPAPTRNGHKVVPAPMADYYLEICRWLGLDCPPEPEPRLYIGAELARRGQALLHKYGVAGNEILVGLNPGASFGSSKCWPADYFARLAELCAQRLRAKIIIFSGPGEEDIVQAIVEQTQADVIDTRPDAIDLELLKPLVQRCNLLVSNDTGPRHYAVALHVPVVVIMGPTDPRYTNANLDRTVVVRKELDCSPCHKKVCPWQHECMIAIQPEEVFTAAEHLLRTCK
jgi:heptosyltransferase-2